MILWANAKSIEQPNDQRVEVLGLFEDGTFNLMVRLCGQPDKEYVISPRDVCGVEIGDFSSGVILKFDKKTIETRRDVCGVKIGDFSSGVVLKFDKKNN